MQQIISEDQRQMEVNNRPRTNQSFNLEEVKEVEPASSELLSLEETTIEALHVQNLDTEDRICNKEELDNLELYNQAFCIICREVIMPNYE